MEGRLGHYKRCSRKEHLQVQCGLAQAHDKHKKMQLDNDISEVISHNPVSKRCSSKRKKNKAPDTSNKASKATQSPMKKNAYLDHGEDSPPPSSDEYKASSLLSIVRPHKLKECSSDSESDSDNLGGGQARWRRRRRRRRRRKLFENTRKRKPRQRKNQRERRKKIKIEKEQ